MIELTGEYGEDELALSKEFHTKRVALAEETLLPLAIAGERWAALRVIGICGDAIGGGIALPPAVANWLCAVLVRVAYGDSIEEAAKISKRPKGAKKEGAAGSSRGRRHLMAHQFGVRFEHEHMKQIAAAAEVATLFGVDAETVMSAWKEFKGTVRNEIELEARYASKVFKITSPQ